MTENGENSVQEKTMKDYAAAYTYLLPNVEVRQGTKEFYANLNVLAKILSKLDKKYHPMLMDVLSEMMVSYVEQKVSNELDNSILRLLKS